MFATVARMRHIFITSLLFAPAVLAREDALFTSSISYCEPPESILIDQFDITYFAKNTSVSFNVSAASVSSINATANLLVNVYGMSPLNYTLDLCHIFSGALCPLPTYNFIGADSITLPSSVDVASHIPGIAYKIPDLEAFAQLILTDSATGEVKACVQATLSNGWSAHQGAVEWATGGLALFALASAYWHSTLAGSLAPVRLLDLLYLFQSIAASGLYALNFPSVYRAYTLNFAWALGLFRSSNIQDSITSTRSKTGGHIGATVANTVGLINRKVSPWNIGSSQSTFSTGSFQPPQSLVTQLHALPVLNMVPSTQPLFARDSVPANLTHLAASTAGTVQTVTSDSDNILNPGVPIYVNSLHIPTANAFMTVFIVSLIFIAIAIGILGATYALVLSATRGQPKSGRLDEFKSRFVAFAAGWGVRIALVLYTPLLIFIFFQWTLKDSWLSILLSVFALLCLLSTILLPSFRLFLTARREGAAALPAYQGILSSSEPLHIANRNERWYATYTLLVAGFVKALVIGLVKNHGKTQVIITIVVEVLLFIALIALKPAHTRRGDVLSSYLAITRILCAGLSVAFIESLEVKAIPRVVVGIVLAVILSIAVIVMFFDIVRNLGLINFFRRQRPAAESAPLNARQDSGQMPQLEKGDVSIKTPTRSVDAFDTSIQESPSSTQQLRPLDYRTSSS